MVYRFDFRIADIFAIHDIETEIIAASIRHPMHITEAALNGAHIATIPYKVIMQLFNHPLTDKGIEAFLKDWEARVQHTKVRSCTLFRLDRQFHFDNFKWNYINVFYIDFFYCVK